jgi:hypothetical protein
MKAGSVKNINYGAHDHSGGSVYIGYLYLEALIKIKEIEKEKVALIKISKNKKKFNYFKFFKKI